MCTADATTGSFFTSQNAATAGLGMQAASLASSTIGSYYASKAQKSALKAQAEIAELNASILEQQAQKELLVGQKREQQSRMKYGALKSSQKAAMAANGVDLGVGNANEILTSTDLMSEVDANNIKADAIANAWGYRIQSTNASNAALMKTTEASAISPVTAGATTFLSGASRVATNAYMLDKYSGGNLFGGGSSSSSSTDKGTILPSIRPGVSWT